MRRRYKCKGCGLEIEGRERTDGTIVADDRSACGDGPILPALCVPCAEKADHCRYEIKASLLRDVTVVSVPKGVPLDASKAPKGFS